MCKYINFHPTMTGSVVIELHSQENEILNSRENNYWKDFLVITIPKIEFSILSNKITSNSNYLPERLSLFKLLVIL